jgi:hypothetical protein
MSIDIVSELTYKNCTSVRSSFLSIFDSLTTNNSSKFLSFSGKFSLLPYISVAYRKDVRHSLKASTPDGLLELDLVRLHTVSKALSSPTTMYWASVHSLMLCLRYYQSKLT